MEPDDVDAALAINQANLADVDPVGRAELEGLRDAAMIALVAVGPEHAVVGFCLVVDGSSPELTARGRWAMDRPGADLHLERIAFDMQYSGLGLGLAMYKELDARIGEIAEARDDGTATLTSLVRVDPPNEHAIGFHNAWGFATLDEAVFGDTTIELTRKTYGS